MSTGIITVATTIESLIQHCGKNEKSCFSKRKIKIVKNHHCSLIKKLIKRLSTTLDEILPYPASRFNICVYKIFLKQNPTLHHLENRKRDLDHQIDILNNLGLEGLDICSKNNLSKMEQSEWPKFINDRTIIIKPADIGGTTVIFSTEHFKTMIMQHLDDASTYKRLNLNIDMI